MEKALDVVRRRIETQGFRGLTDEQIRKLDPWIRFTPFVNALMGGLAALRLSAGLFVFVSLMALLGVVMSRHPFDVFYNRAIRLLEGTPELPRSSIRRRLVFLVVALLALSAAGCLATGRTNMGLALGLGMAAVQAFVAAHQLCVISEAIERVKKLFRA
jgi:hypothetical protein